MAELSGLDMVREIIGQINNLRRLVTINGKKYKWDGKKYVRAVDGKTFTKKELVSYVKDETFRAPGTDNPRKDPSRPKKQTFKTKLQSKAKGVSSNVKKTAGKTINKGNQLLQNARLRIGKPNATPSKANALKMNRYMKPNVQGGKGILNAFGLQGGNWLADQLVDRGSRAIGGMNNMSLDQYRAMRDKRLTDLESGKFKKDLKTLRNIQNVTQGVKNPEQTGGVIGRRIQQEKPPTLKQTEKPKEKLKSEQKKSDTPYWQSPKYTQPKPKKKKKSEALKVNKQLERRKKAIRRAYGNISEKRMKQLLSRAVTQRELEES